MVVKADFFHLHGSEWTTLKHKEDFFFLMSQNIFFSNILNLSNMYYACVSVTDL